VSEPPDGEVLSIVFCAVVALVVSAGGEGAWGSLAGGGSFAVPVEVLGGSFEVPAGAPPDSLVSAAG